MLFTILPLKGIQWDNQYILLGNTREAVEAKLGQPEIVGNSYYYFKSELRLDFSGEDKLEFIEFLAGYNGDIQPLIYGVQAFQVGADELYHVLKEHNYGDIIDNENGYSFAFPNIGIGIFRESIPDNVTDLISEMKEMDIDITENSNIEEERLKASHWATISLASPNYSW
ncbi:hypothetical protein ACTQ33_06490 [Candidatus Avoscillospira sp. LCP25S3_F1]|uniref:hypothetical protein n=1 Tax=Candidatus Avoscillospira sp. LCP25S3_F1 TaxID=3438825 RepID=UPI003F92BBF6